MKNKENKFDNNTECDKAKAEIKKLFDSLKIVASPGKYSLEEALATAISEGKKFLEWKNSGRPLHNIWLFYKTGDKLVPIIQFQSFSSLKSFGTSFQTSLTESSQFEIWECDENNEREFPLYRILLSELSRYGQKKAGLIRKLVSMFTQKTEIVLVERLREDVLLKIYPEAEHGLLTFKVSFDLTTNPKTGIQKGEKLSLKAVNRFKKGFIALQDSAFDKLVKGAANVYRKASVCSLNSLLASLTESDCFPNGNVRDNERIYRISDLFKPALAIS